MKINFKTIIIVFLVAMLGAGIGTYVVVKMSGNDPMPITQSKDKTDVTISEITYANKKDTNFTEAIKKAYNTVVEINAQVEQQGFSANYFFFESTPSYTTVSGSGVIISEDGYIVTNEHVVAGADEGTVDIKLYNGESYKAEIIGYDTRTDLALLKIDENNLPYSSFADSSQLIMGEDVIAIGNPLGLGVSCSNGIVSALEKEIYINNVYINVIQTNAAVNEGNSGGGLFDLNGNIIGIVNAKKSSSASSAASVEGMGYAIPSNTVKRIIYEIMDNGYVKDRAALGVRVYTGNSSYYQTNGVLVTEVVEGGSADEAGIKPNDIITAIDDDVVTSYGDLSKVLDTKQVGDTVTVTVNRDGKQINFKVVLQQSASN